MQLQTGLLEYQGSFRAARLIDLSGVVTAMFISKPLATEFLITYRIPRLL